MTDLFQDEWFGGWSVESRENLQLLLTTVFSKLHDAGINCVFAPLEKRGGAYFIDEAWDEARDRLDSHYLEKDIMVVPFKWESDTPTHLCIQHSFVSLKGPQKAMDILVRAFGDRVTWDLSLDPIEIKL